MSAVAPCWANHNLAADTRSISRLSGNFLGHLVGSKVRVQVNMNLKIS